MHLQIAFVAQFILFSTTFLMLPYIEATNTTSPKQYVLPIVKDIYKKQYYTSLEIGTPRIRVYLTIDLGNLNTWMDCWLYNYTTSTSSTLHEHSCHSRQCALYGAPHRPWCIDTDMCGVYTYTPWSQGVFAWGVYEDTMSMYTSISKVSKITLPHFLVACTSTEPIKGISRYTKGIVSLARTGFGLPLQVSSNLGVPRKFALCVPSSDTASTGVNGEMYFGGGPYFLSSSALDFGKVLVTSPLIINSISTAPTGSFEKGDPSYEYFISVRSIKINKSPAQLNSTLLSINPKTGFGGTKISTMSPYTMIHSDIYNAFVKTFVAQAAAMSIIQVPAVTPFGACFSTHGIATTTTGPVVPINDLVLDGTSKVLHGKNSRWRIYGANSMVRVGRNVVCLAFVDGGRNAVFGGSPAFEMPMASIVIGGYQLENNLVEFDLEGNKIGISSSLLRWNTSCSQFKGY